MKFKGLATIKGENYCCQPYFICSECDCREELGCRDAVVDIEFLKIKEETAMEAAAAGVNKINNSIKTSSAITKKLTRQLRSMESSLRKVKRVK
jgi:hypothetical protein